MPLCYLSRICPRPTVVSSQVIALECLETMLYLATKLMTLFAGKFYESSGELHRIWRSLNHNIKFDLIIARDRERSLTGESLKLELQVLVLSCELLCF